ncbi:MAG: c-type cytochrome [Acidobacteriota bacterium]
MRSTLCLLLGVMAGLIACGGSNSETAVSLPEGNVEAGRAVFSQFECYTCHEVKGEEYPAPTVITPTYVTLGAGQGMKSRTYLAESIIAPSHEFATPRPPDGKTAGDANIMSGRSSRMTDFSDRMTIRQLCDLSAYLEHLQSLPKSGSM